MQRKKRHIEGDVQLNMAAMLDMAFQLLAFFILTYRPAPVEGWAIERMEALAKETKVRAVSLTTHNLPPGGDYFSYERALATTILEGLK